MSKSAIIDFNGYLTSNNKFVMREYSVYFINDSGEIQDTSFEVADSTTDNLNDLDIKTRNNYDNYYDKYGIEFSTSSENANVIKRDLKRHFVASYYIFVINEEQKNLLINYFDNYFNVERKFQKFICLDDDLNFKVNIKNSTNCHYHKSPQHNNCANDNVMEMVSFITDKKLYSTNILKNLHIIIDFNYYKISNSYYEVKELSIVKMDFEAKRTKSNLYVVKPNDKSQIMPSNHENYYKNYYETYGIKWNVGNEILKTVKWSLSVLFSNSLFIYVKDKYHKEALSTITHPKHTTKLLCLDELGYDIGNTELMFTNCKWHDDKAINNCADDNVRLMTDWLVRTELYKPHVRNDLLRRQINNNDNVYDDIVIADRHAGSRNNDNKMVKYYQADNATTSTSAARKSKSKAAQYYDAFASTLSSSNEAKKRQRSDDDDDDDDDDVFNMASKLGIKIKDSDDDVFDIASELGIEVKDDNTRIINETVAPNVSRYYQAHGSNDFRINQTEEQTNYDDESAINIALELESQAGKHTPKNIGDLSPESLSKYSIDNVHNYSFGSNEFDDLLHDDEIIDNDNHYSKVEVNQRDDRTGEKLLSSSVFNDPTNLFDDDDDDDDFNNFMNIDALLHSEAMSDDDDQENEIFDEKLLDTYIVNNPNNISFDEDEFNDILAEDEL